MNKQDIIALDTDAIETARHYDEMATKAEHAASQVDEIKELIVEKLTAAAGFMRMGAIQFREAAGHLRSIHSDNRPSGSCAKPAEKPAGEPDADQGSTDANSSQAAPDADAGHGEDSGRKAAA